MIRIWRYAWLSLWALTVWTSAVHAEGMGRLFFSPEQRAMLDLARDRAPINSAQDTSLAPAASGVTLNGVVTRSDGQSNAWVNGKMEQGVRYRGTPERNQVRVNLPGGGVKLKVGQTYDPANGKVEESYQRFPPAPPAPPAASPPVAAAPKTETPLKANIPPANLRDDDADTPSAPAQ